MCLPSLLLWKSFGGKKTASLCNQVCRLFLLNFCQAKCLRTRETMICILHEGARCKETMARISQSNSEMPQKHKREAITDTPYHTPSHNTHTHTHTHSKKTITFSGKCWVWENFTVFDWSKSFGALIYRVRQQKPVPQNFNSKEIFKKQV